MSLNPILRRRGQGEILKAERMLVRIERIDNPNQKLPADYNEGTSVDTRLKRAWREYYVVARIGQNANKHVTLYIHKSRVVSLPFWVDVSEFLRRRIRIPARLLGGKSNLTRRLRGLVCFLLWIRLLLLCSPRVTRDFCCLF